MGRPTSRTSGSKPQTKNLHSPDELLTFEKGRASTVRVADMVVSLLEQQPGWRWSEHIKPVAGTDSCQFHHIGFSIPGAFMVHMDDGSETMINAGDVFEIPPGHDVWVVGDEPAVSVNWGGWHGWGRPPLGDRLLTTMLMTDIAGSTRLAAELGDAAWGQILEAHNSRVREVFDRYRGQEIAMTGDGFLAVFDGAERAIRCAVDIRSATERLGLQIRAAVHTGEVEFVPGNIRGLAVHEAARILTLAGPDDILASGTTRELVSGSDFRFEDRGRHEFKGIPGPRQLYALRTDDG